MSRCFDYRPDFIGFDCGSRDEDPDDVDGPWLNAARKSGGVEFDSKDIMFLTRDDARKLVAWILEAAR